MKFGASRAALLLFFVAALLALPVRAQKPEAPAISPAKRALIERLLELTGASNMSKQLMDAMIANFRKSSPEVPAEFWDRFQKEIDMDQLMNEIFPIYDRHLSEEDLKGVVAFYESPVGRKVTAELPAIMQESMSVGQSWGMALAKRITETLRKEKETKGGGGKP